MVTFNEIEDWLEDWSLPLGPFKTIDEVLEDMAFQAGKLQPDDAPLLASIAAEYGRAHNKKEQVLSMFLQEYAIIYPEPFAEALLKNLNSFGPPILLYLLGSTKNQSSIPYAKRILNLENTDSDLLISWACFLGEAGGNEAMQLLEELRVAPNVDPEVLAEVNIAVQNIKSGY
jgi:hypothetical protein